MEVNTTQFAQEGRSRTIIFFWDAIIYYYLTLISKNDGYFKLSEGGKSGKCVTLATPEKSINVQMLFVRS